MESAGADCKALAGKALITMPWSVQFNPVSIDDKQPLIDSVMIDGDSSVKTTIDRNAIIGIEVVRSIVISGRKRSRDRTIGFWKHRSWCFSMNLDTCKRSESVESDGLRDVIEIEPVCDRRDGPNSFGTVLLGQIFALDRDDSVSFRLFRSLRHTSRSPSGIVSLFQVSTHTSRP
jgi:hypothetical protein